ncbi:MAG: F0F1 ATP synthase subunit B [Deltaproteobacteria bacterium]|nr:F0F1 ATP synthase subunit B [Deltaproteobacteria bacterium]
MRVQSSEFRVQSVLLLTAYCLLPTLAFGAEEGVEGGKDLIWRVINFAILVGLLYLLLAKRVREFLTTRRKAIETALEEARKAKEEAERKQKECEALFAAFNKRVEEIFRDLRAEGEIEKERIIEEARKSAKRMKEEAWLTAEQEIKKAREGIREEVVRLAIEMAEDILRKEITKADQERLVKEYLDRMKMPLH